MIGVLHQVQGGTGAELTHERSEELEGGELISSALNEEHRDVHIEQVLGTVGAGPTRRMQWKGEKDESSDLPER